MNSDTESRTKGRDLGEHDGPPRRFMSESLKPKVDPTRFGLRGIRFHRGWRGIDCGRILKPSTASSWFALVLCLDAIGGVRLSRRERWDAVTWKRHFFP